jgi:urea carboxylase
VTATTARLDVIDAGPFTTVQDHPGRIGYWHVGVPPSGPMDDVSHRLANRVVGNRAGAAALELTGRGPVLRFDAEVVVALGGAAMAMSVDGRAVPPWHPVVVPAGATLAVGALVGPGLRSTLAVRGAMRVETYLGSASTFTLGGFGGHEGRCLRAGDVLVIGDEVESPPFPLPPGAAPVLTHEWEIGVLVGPHGAPDFLTLQGLDDLWRAKWEVHFNSARTGVRLIGPRPGWARPDGGEAGLHPSNIHDTGYAFGAVDLTGDMPVILGPDGPSLGGFVCPAVVASAERWKLGQLAPGDRVRLSPWSPAQAKVAAVSARRWIRRATDPAEPLVRPSWNALVGRSGSAADTVMAQLEPDGVHPGATYRRAGDQFVLVEYGPMVLDLELRVRAHALDTWARTNLGPGLIDVTAGSRSVLVHVDDELLDVTSAVSALRAAEADLGDLAATPFASRVVHLPLSWDDPATREAIDRYMHGVRADAPWCPWNIEFIRRINGLESVDDVRRVVFDASYLVLGLGDVYLGAPVATPLDPRHRLVTTKYNPARTWTPENAVGIGGAYLCIYGMEGPGGYQFVGRTVQVWNRHQRGPHFEEPWMLRTFDQIRFHPVEAEQLMEMRADHIAGRLELGVERSSFCLADHQRFLVEHAAEIDRFRCSQRDAFDAERRAWHAAGEFAVR